MRVPGSLRANHRVTEDTEDGGQQAWKRTSNTMMQAAKRWLLPRFCLLGVLCDSVVRKSIRRSGSDKTPYIADIILAPPQIEREREIAVTPSGIAGIWPGVWPILKNRATRRLSASLAFTGNVS